MSDKVPFKPRVDLNILLFQLTVHQHFFLANYSTQPVTVPPHVLFIKLVHVLLLI